MTTQQIQVGKVAVIMILSLDAGSQVNLVAGCGKQRLQGRSGGFSA